MGRRGISAYRVIAEAGAGLSIQRIPASPARIKLAPKQDTLKVTITAEEK